MVATANEFAMVSEWMPNGNIKEYIGTHQDANRFELVSPPLNIVSFSVLLIVTTLRQLADVAKGLVHVHSQGMIHRDLKGVCL